MKKKASNTFYGNMSSYKDEIANFNEIIDNNEINDFKKQPDNHSERGKKLKLSIKRNKRENSGIKI